MKHLLTFLIGVLPLAFAWGQTSPGDDAFAAGKFETALESYRKQRDAEDRPDEKQRLTAQCVRSLHALGRSTESCQEFFTLCRIAPFSKQFDCIPLVWFASRSFTPVGNTANEKLALQWIHPKTNPSGIENPAASLLAASILLSSAQQANRSRALEQLEQLTFVGPDAPEKEIENQVRKQIAILAQMQLRRTKIAVLKSENELTEWESTLENLADPLRAGPWYIIGQGYAKLQNDEQAVLCWMRIPILYPEQRPLVEQALRDAAQSLQKLQRPEEAKTLLEEIQRLKSPTAEAR